MELDDCPKTNPNGDTNKESAWICSTVLVPPSHTGRSPWREPVWGGCWRQTHRRDIPKTLVFAWFRMAMAVSAGSPASSSEVRCEGCKSVVASVALLQCDWKPSIGCSHCWVPGGNSERANVRHTHTHRESAPVSACMCWSLKWFIPLCLVQTSTKPLDFRHTWPVCCFFECRHVPHGFGRLPWKSSGNLFVCSIQ